MNNFIIFLTVVLFISVYGLDSFAEESQIIIDLENSTMKMIDESNFEDALIYIDEILEIDPNNTNALNNKGGVLAHLGNHSDAITQFDHVLEINENNTEALNNKAISLYHQELYVTSLRTFWKSILTDPYNHNTINNTKDVADKLYWIDETETGYGTISVRDKNDNLISYEKIREIKVQPPLGYILLERIGDAKEVEVDGKTIQVLHYSGWIPLNKDRYIGSATLTLHHGDFQLDVIQLGLNGLIASWDDKVTYDLIIAVPGF